MKERAGNVAPEVPHQFGVLLEPALARRDRFAERNSEHYGEGRMFSGLVEELLGEVPKDVRVLEVGAATGLITERLIEKASSLTALEPSKAMVARLLSSGIGEDERLTVMQGLAEDLAPDAIFDVAVVTFTIRRGVGLVQLVGLLAGHVRDRIVMLLDEDGTLDWAYVARELAVRGYPVRMRIVSGTDESGEARRAVVLVADVAGGPVDSGAATMWQYGARVIDMPYPAPRGAATRLMKYFFAGGDRALMVRTEPAGRERLYGNLRTAAHRIGREQVTVRRVDEGVQIVRLPRPVE